MPTRTRVIAAIGAGLALLATLASGRHLDIARNPVTARLPDRPMPSISQTALKRGCEAWGEDAARCVSNEPTGPYAWPDRK